MGLAKYDEDIRETIDTRMRDKGRPYYGTTHINRYPDYISNRYTSPASTSRCSTSYSTPISSSPIKTSTTTLPKTTPPKPQPKIGTVRRNYELNGIEIYFDYKPSVAVRDKLKANYWRWHDTKRCWYRTYTAENMKFAETIIIK